MPRFLSPGKLCEITGLPAPTLESLVREGAIVPAIPGEGRGIQRKYTAGQALAIALSRSLRHRQGWSLRSAGNVLQALLSIPDDALARDIGDGRDHLMVVNGNCFPILTHEAAIDHNEQIAEIVRDCKAAGITVDIQALDIGSAWAELLSRLDEKPVRKRKAKVQR